MKPYIVIDVNNLAHRNWHALANVRGEFTHRTLFGMLRDISFLEEVLGPGRFVFCFDSETNFRKLECPGYKAKRPEPPDRGLLHGEIHDLKTILHNLGFRNCLCHHGFEADDLMAFITQRKGPEETVYLVSSDQDLYQLLADKVLIWDPHKKQTINKASLWVTHGATPGMWLDAKTLAGCPGDNIDGIPGVGMVTALKFLREELKPCKTSDKIILRDQLRCALVRRLVELPYRQEPAPTIKLVPDNLNLAKWKRILAEYKISKFQTPPGG
jgi:DNA polymerase I